METAAKKALLPVASASKPVPTPALLLAMLGVSTKVSDLILSPGSFPMVELSGKLTPVKISGMAPLTPEDTRRIAYELIEDNKQATDSLQNLGSCDISYRVPGRCRFRVNIFQQRGSHAIVMRVIPGHSHSCRTESAPATRRNRRPPEWDRPGNRSNRIGEIFNLGCGSRSHQ